MTLDSYCPPFISVSSIRHNEYLASQEHGSNLTGCGGGTSRVGGWGKRTRERGTGAVESPYRFEVTQIWVSFLRLSHRGEGTSVPGGRSNGQRTDSRLEKGSKNRGPYR